MEEFINVHRDCIVGVRHGFDRLVFRGTLRSISHKDGLARYLNAQGILLKDFDAWARRCTQRLGGQIEAAVQAAGRPVIYLASAAVSKEQRAVEIARKDQITSGLVACLTCVEPCLSPTIRRNAHSRRLELTFTQRKCKFYYLYLIDPVFGWMPIRLQSWIPFDVQICLNGRSYLQGQLDQAQIRYVKVDNCFTQIDDPERAQVLLDQLVSLNGPVVLRRLLAPFSGRRCRRGVFPKGRSVITGRFVKASWPVM